jgi:hypothetical protein
MDIYFVLVGADRVRPTPALIATILGAFDPIARAAGRQLQVITGPAPARVPPSNVFRLNFALTTSAAARRTLGYDSGAGRSICMRGLNRPVALGEEGGGSVFVDVILDFRVGGGAQMTGTMLRNPSVNYGAQAELVFENNDPVFARAVGATAIHELGHMIGRLGDTADATNFMGPASDRRAAGNRELIRRTMSEKSFTPAQAARLQSPFRALP